MAIDTRSTILERPIFGAAGLATTLFRVFCALIVLVAPFISGALPLSIFLPLLIVTLVVLCYAIVSRSDLAIRTVLVILSVTITLTACDLGARFLNVVPDDLIRRWPRLPLVNRYLANINIEGHTFSAYARTAAHDEWIEKKSIKLITDSSGFRNESLNLNRALDVIILGDSFGAGAVSQEDTWTSILSRDHHLNTYNLSAPASGPWHEYVNLWTEKKRLKTNKETILIWQLFTGNDLEDYYGNLELAHLPWNGAIGAWLVRIDSMRSGSPLRYVFRERYQNNDVLDFDFLNGRKLLFYKPYIESSSRTLEQILRHPNYELLRSTIHAVKGLADSQGLRLSIMLVPAKEEVYSWVWKGKIPWSTEIESSGLSVALKKLCAEENIGYLDLKPSLVHQSRRIYEESGQLLYWYDDPHLNTAGSRFTGAVIYDELIKGQRATLDPQAH